MDESSSCISKLSMDIWPILLGKYRLEDFLGGSSSSIRYIAVPSELETWNQEANKIGYHPDVYST